MIKKLQKFILTFAYFFSKKTDNQSHKSLLIIEGPSAIGLVELLRKKGSLPVTYYVPLQPFSIFNKIRSKNQPYYYPGLIEVLKCIILGCIKSLKTNSERNLILNIEFELISNCFNNSKNIYSSVVIFNERMPLSAFASEWARSEGILSCCVQHGAVVENYFPIMVERYFVWDDKFSEIIKSSGTNVETILTGRLLKEPIIKNIARSNIPLIILQPSNVSIPEKIIIASFVELIAECLNIYGEVVLRPHPNDNNLEKILGHFSNNENIKVESGDLINSLCSRNIVISLYSTVLLEAINCGCLAIQYINKNWYEDIFYRSQYQIEGREALKIFIDTFTNRKKIDNIESNKISSILKPNVDHFLDNIIF
jgi:hypothetical protein